MIQSVFFENDESRNATVIEEHVGEAGVWGLLVACRVIENAIGMPVEKWDKYLTPEIADGTICYNAGHTKKEPGKEYTQYDVYICPDCRVYLNAITYKLGKSTKTLGEYVKQETIAYIPEAYDD